MHALGSSRCGRAASVAVAAAATAAGIYSGVMTRAESATPTRISGSASVRSAAAVSSIVTATAPFTNTVGEPSPGFSFVDVHKKFDDITGGDKPHMIYKALAGVGQIEDYRVFVGPDNTVEALVRVGDQLVGHPSTVHGGATAAILDNLFGTLFYVAKPGQIAFTANLTVNYRSPWMANDTVRFRGRVEKVDGRKIFLTGYFEDVETGKRVVDSTALFIIPRSGAPPKPRNRGPEEGKKGASSSSSSSSSLSS